MILFENVTKTYPRTTRPALDDVNLEIPRGEFAFVVGTSGSGKSTLMQLVMKEQDASRGRILVAGRDLDRLPERKVPALRREIGCVFQDFRLLPNKTVFQNVAYALQVLGSSRARIRQTVPETLELVGLAGMEKRLPHQLSGGEQQRVAIARAFVNRPPILLADEPTGNLDPDTSLGIVQLLDRINRTGTTVVMATHDTVTVNAMRKRVIRLDGGVLVSDMEAGDYTTGSIPRIRLGDEGAARPAADPEVPDGCDDGAPTAYAGDPAATRAPGGPEAGDREGALAPIGRDADAPRAKGGIFRRHKAVHTSDR
ncbi:cell division ATP-binding protein FtsE [Terrabacter carboxydivorans]|uniref:Cell division ATP-binding protein FtsE n=1 Tax=Terrabacter carboxydivorans TaxID=619730 RepID=A0ABN3LPB2_9MICO